jgi:hypothetical protein
MAQTTIIEEQIDSFNQETGEIYLSKKRAVRKSRIEPTDEFVKVSKYLNVIFAYHNIPLNLVPISLIFAQRMEFKTNVLYLLIGDKREIAEMLQLSLDRVNALVKECKKYNIIRPIERGKFEVNSFLFSTGSIAETRDLQAHFEFENDKVIVSATQKNLITGSTVKKAVMNKKDKNFPNQLSFLE